MYLHDPSDAKIGATENNGVNNGGGMGTLKYTVDPNTIAWNVTDSGLLNMQDFRAELSGYQWASSSIYYSFPSLSSQYGSNYGDPDAVNSNLQQLTDAQQNVAQRVFADVAGFTNLTFTQITADSTHTPQIRLAQSDKPPTSYAYYPFSNNTAGDAFFGPSVNDTPAAGSYSWDTIAHELGHALGLKHGHADENTGKGVLPADHDSHEFSIMTYRSALHGITNSFTNAEGSAPLTFMASDMLALQYMYGANYTTHNENTNYKWTPGSSTLLINGAAETGSATNTLIDTVWDGGGEDTYDFSAYSTNLNIDLGAGHWTLASTAQLADLSSGYGGDRYARGNIYNSFLVNGNTASLIEDAVGGSASDTFVGNVGNNRFEGGNGADTFTSTTGSDYFAGGNGIDILKIQDATIDYVTKNAAAGETVIHFVQQASAPSDNQDGRASNNAALSMTGAYDVVIKNVEEFQIGDGSLQNISTLDQYIKAASPFTLLSDSAKTTAQFANALFLNGAGTGLSISNAAYTGSSTAASLYDGSLNGLDIQAGILLTTGDGSPPITNTSTGYSSKNDQAGDADLLAAAQAGMGSNAQATYDASVLTFTLNVASNAIKSVALDVGMGSEEYPEFVNNFVDIGAIIVNGVNYALVNGSTAQPYSVLSSNIKAGFFVNNQGGLLPIEYDGVSNKVTIFVPVTQGKNTFKIGVADTNDAQLDTGLFVSNLRASGLDLSGMKNVITTTDDLGVYVGTGNNDLFQGSAGDDTFDATAGGDDVVDAGDGNDNATFTFLAGESNAFIGGKGVDKAILNGNIQLISGMTQNLGNGVHKFFFSQVPAAQKEAVAEASATYSIVLDGVETIQIGENALVEVQSLFGMEVGLATDAGLSGDNLTNNGQLMLTGLGAGPVTYTLDSIVKGIHKLVGKANTLLTGAADGVAFDIPALHKGAGYKDGTYQLTVKQGDQASTLDFTIDTKLPANLKVALASDSGKKSDKITNDSTIKLTSVEADATLQYHVLSKNGIAQEDAWHNISAQASLALGSEAAPVAAATPPVSLALALDDGSYKLEFRQIDLAGNASKKNTAVNFTLDKIAPTVVVDHSLTLANGQNGTLVFQSDERLVGFDKKDLAIDTKLFSIIGNIKEKLVDSHWNYTVSIKAASSGDGSGHLAYADSAAATDIAGNALDFAAIGAVEITVVGTLGAIGVA